MSETSQALETSPNGEFSLSQARSIVGEFFKPNPWIFWPDFLISWTVGLVCFGLVLHPEKVTENVALHWPLSILFFVVSGLLYYRSVLFIHELVHIRAGQFTAFRVVWNLLCGIPFLVPTFLYYTHLDHHRRKHYGTTEDGEYIPLARLPIYQLFVYLAQIPVVPILAVIRFGALTPLTWISKPIRNLVHRRASSMIMDPLYIRPLPTKRVLRIIRLQEVGCFLFIWFMVIRFFTSFGLVASEPLPKMLLVQIYLTAMFILTLNALRTLGAHRWTNNGEEMNFVDQMLDSVNYPYNPILGALWAPVGLRFHALHHIFPTMPYHALATAHKRLMAELPADSPYRRCEARTLTGALWLLWKRARDSGRGVPPTEIAAPA